MRRITDFDFHKRESLSPYYKYGQDEIEGLKIPWTSELHSIDGAHYHVWINPRWSAKYQKHIKDEFKKAAYWKGDPVSFSWDFIPDSTFYFTHINEQALSEYRSEI